MKTMKKDFETEVKEIVNKLNKLRNIELNQVHSRIEETLIDDGSALSRYLGKVLTFSDEKIKKLQSGVIDIKKLILLKEVHKSFNRKKQTTMIDEFIRDRVENLPMFSRLNKNMKNTTLIERLQEALPTHVAKILLMHHKELRESLSNVPLKTKKEWLTEVVLNVRNEGEYKVAIELIEGIDFGKFYHKNIVIERFMQMRFGEKEFSETPIGEPIPIGLRKFAIFDKESSEIIENLMYGMRLNNNDEEETKELNQAQVKPELGLKIIPAVTAFSAVTTIDEITVSSLTKDLIKFRTESETEKVEVGNCDFDRIKIYNVPKNKKEVIARIEVFEQIKDYSSNKKRHQYEADVFDLCFIPLLRDERMSKSREVVFSSSLSAYRVANFLVNNLDDKAIQRVKDKIWKAEKINSIYPKTDGNKLDALIDLRGIDKSKWGFIADTLRNPIQILDMVYQSQNIGTESTTKQLLIKLFGFRTTQDDLSKSIELAISRHFYNIWEITKIPEFDDVKNSIEFTSREWWHTLMRWHLGEELVVSDHVHEFKQILKLYLLDEETETFNNKINHFLRWLVADEVGRDVVISAISSMMSNYIDINKVKLDNLIKLDDNLLELSIQVGLKKVVEFQGHSH